MKPTIATTPDGTTIIQVPTTTAYTLDDINAKIDSLTANIGMRESSLISLAEQIKNVTDEKTSLEADLATWQSYLAEFPIDVQPIDPQPLPVVQPVI